MKHLHSNEEGGGEVDSFIDKKGFKSIMQTSK